MGEEEASEWVREGVSSEGGREGGREVAAAGRRDYSRGQDSARERVPEWVT